MTNLQHLTSTFSIIAFQADVAELGLAVQSNAFAIGSPCLWSKAGVGGVVTQSFLNVSFGPIGLELMANGKTPAQVLSHFKSMDSKIELRQVGILDTKGNVVSFTGKMCVPPALGVVGENYAVQGNVLTDVDVVYCMALAFEGAEGSLAKRLLAALRAGQAAGGDARESRSSAIIIEKENSGRLGQGSREIDLRVEDHANPTDELERLVNISEKQQELARILERANDNPYAAIERAMSIIGDLPGYAQDAWVNMAVLQFAVGRRDDARRSIKKALDIEPGLSKVIAFCPRLGMLPQWWVKEVLEG